MRVSLVAFVVAVVVSPSLVVARRAFEAHAFVPDYRDIARAFDACAHPSGDVVRILAFSAELSREGEVVHFARAPSRAKAANANASATRQHAETCAFDLVIGGAGRSEHFAWALETTGATAIARAVAEVVLERGYDGASYDWEYPTTRREWRRYAALLRETKNALGDEYRVTFAVHPGAETFKRVREEKMLDVADGCYVMAYDFSSNGLEGGIDDGHSSLRAVRGMMEYMETLNVSSERTRKKLVLGIPFYGRRVRNFNDARTYEELVRAMGDGFSQSRTKVDNVVFNSVDVVRAKVREAKKFGYGGVVVWELGQDVKIDVVGVSLFDAILDEIASVDDVRDEL